MIIRKKSATTIKAIEKISKKKLTLGNLLWAIREGDEVSQVNFAKKLGITRQFLCDLEHERRTVSPKLAAQYAKKLGYSEAQFVRLCLQDILIKSGLHLEVEVRKAA